MKWPFQRNGAATGLVGRQLKEALDELSFIREEIEANREGEFLLAEDEIGWNKIGIGKDVLDESKRRDIVKAARKHALLDPLCAQDLRLYTGFSIGKGIEWAAREDKAQEDLDIFWKKNRRLTSTTGQQRLSNKFLIDGEHFIGFHFTGTNRKEAEMRIFDSLEFVDVALDKEDADTPRYYKRVRETRGGEQETLFYRDWLNDEKVPGELANGDVIDEDLVKPGAPVIYHIKFQEGGNGVHGYSLFTAKLSWAVAYRSFMKSRVAVQQGLARIAKKMKVKGGQAAVNAQKAQHESTLANTSTQGEDNPAPAFGSTLVHNAAMDLENMKQETGAQAAQVDGSMLLVMAGAAVGVFPHYYGSGESFRLATASAMETPMLKVFQSYSFLWVEVWQSIFMWVLKDEDVFVDVDPPDIFPGDTTETVANLIALCTKFTDFADLDSVKKLALMLLGLNNVDEIVEELEKIVDEKPPPPPLPPGGIPSVALPPNDDQQPPQAAATEVEAARLLIEIMTKEGAMTE